MYTISQLKSDLTSTLHTSNLNQVVNIDGLILRAGRKLLEDVDPQETQRRFPVSLFSEVEEYAAPVDLKGNRVIDLLPQTGSQSLIGQTYQKDFRKYQETRFSVIYRDSVKLIQARDTLLNPVQVEAVSEGFTGTSTTSTDTTTAFNSQSLTMTPGYAEKTIQSVDLSSHANKSTLFLRVYIQGTLSSIELRWGSSSSDFFSSTQSAPFSGPLQQGWNLFAFPWDSQTGSPTTDISYLRITISGTGNFKANYLTSNLPTPYELIYYSKYLYTSGSSFVESYDSDDDTVNLDTDGVNLLLNLTAAYTTQHLSGKDGASDAAFFLKEYQEGIARYKSKYKSQTAPPINYYWK